MNLDNDNSVGAGTLVNNDVHSGNFVHSVGHVLRNARMARGLSTEDVSRQLRISVKQVEAIEKEDFDKLPGRTFLRGFVRNYANFVQLESAPLLESLPGSLPILAVQERTPFKDKQLSFSANRREGWSGSRLISIVMLLLVIFGAYYILENNTWSQSSVDETTEKSAKSENGKGSMEIQLPISGSIKSEINLPVNKIPESLSNEEKKDLSLESVKLFETLDKKNLQTEETTSLTENKFGALEEGKFAKTNLSDGDTGSLYFTFTADSWIKVVDGKGVPLLEQMRKKGSEQVLTGKKPFSIVVGNASGVNLTYNDKEINIDSYRKQDGTARFKLQ